MFALKMVITINFSCKCIRIAFCGLVASAAECKQISVPEGLSDDKDPSRPLDNLREAKEQV